MRQYPDVFCQFWPQLGPLVTLEQHNPWHCRGGWEHTIHSVEAAPADVALRLAMLLHDIGKPHTLETDFRGITHFHGHPTVSAGMAEEILRRLRFDNETIVTVRRLVEFHDYGNSVELTPVIVRRAMNRIGEDIFSKFLLVKRADIMAQSLYRRREKLEAVEAWDRQYREILARRQCVSLKDLALRGRDLIAAGMKPGPELGAVLQQMLEHVLEAPEDNTREKLSEIFLKVT